MDEKHAMKFLTTETKRWAHVIWKIDDVIVRFEKTLGRYGGECGYRTVYYSRKMILGNLDNQQGLTDLAIHEVIHLKIRGHENDFQKEYEKWSGHPMTRYVNTLNHNHLIVPKKRGEGKTLERKWKVEYIRYEHIPSTSSPSGTAIRCVSVKEKPMTKTQATKIFKMACSKDYPAWLYQYVSSAVAHGWKKIEYHESVCGGQNHPVPKTLEEALTEAAAKKKLDPDMSPVIVTMKAN